MHGRNQLRSTDGNGSSRSRLRLTVGLLLGIWLVAIGAFGWQAASVMDKLSGGGWFAPGSASERVAEEQRSGFAGRGATTVTLIVEDHRFTAPDPRFYKRAEEVLHHVMDSPSLEATSSSGWSEFPKQSANPLVSSDGRVSTERIGLGLDDGVARRTIPEVQHDLTTRFASDGLDVTLVGTAPFWGEVNERSEQGMVRAEILALPIVVLILYLLLRNWTMVAIALSTTVVGIVITFGVLSSIAAQLELSIFVLNAATMLGLGVGVDYALFLLRRMQEERMRGNSLHASLRISLQRAGHTVAASAATVVVGICPLLLIDLNAVRSIAVGGAVAVTVALVANLALLPLLVLLLGSRLGEPATRTQVWLEETRWYRFVAGVMRRPALVLVGTVGFLGLLAVPATQLSTFTPDETIVPSDSPLRSGHAVASEAFGAGATSPVVIVANVDSSAAEVSERIVAFEKSIGELTGVAAVNSPAKLLGSTEALKRLIAREAPDEAVALSPQLGGLVAEDGESLITEVYSRAGASDPVSRELVGQIRDLARQHDGQGLRLSVGGQTAEGIDANAAISENLIPVVVTMVLSLALVLALTFGSLVLPLKVIAINLVSVAATYGVLVTFIQKPSPVADLLNIDTSGHLTNFVPVLLLALLFGLSTDYEVFLLSRVKELRQSGVGERESVAQGVAVTAPIISGAALLMVAVFTAFMLAAIQPIQELGFGLAVAIAIDATIVRLLVVPAAMRLMGRWNWWPEFSLHRVPGWVPRTRKVAVDEV